MTILRLAEEADILSAMYGQKQTVTDYSVHEIFTYLEITKDKSDYLDRLYEIKSKVKNA